MEMNVNDRYQKQLEEYTAEELEDLESRMELYYDRPDVIAGEQFQDKLDMYRNEN
jgi:hypothetical protein